MMRRHPWIFGLATSTSIVGLTVTSGLVLLANRLVDEFSHPHEPLNEAEFDLPIPHLEPEPPRSCQRPLIFQTSDGTLLRGDFWAQPHPAPTVVMCHGYRASRTHLLPGAAIEYKLGYNVLLFDFRGHGGSDSVVTSGGHIEVHDLEAAITAASLQPETLPNSIIIHGFSMGAAVALLTPPHPEVAVIIADSPYARSDEILRRLINHRLITQSSAWTPSLHRLNSLFPAIAWATIMASILIYRVRFGYSYVARPVTSFKQWVAQAKAAQSQRQIPILLIHASGDELVPFTHAHQLATEAQIYGIALETYFVDDLRHCGAYIHDPAHYTTVIQDFLARHMQNDYPNNTTA